MLRGKFPSAMKVSLFQTGRVANHCQTVFRAKEPTRQKSHQRAVDAT